MRTYNYKGHKVYLEKEEYRNNWTLSLMMYEVDGELFGNVTFNLNHHIQSKDMAFLDENNFPGIGKWLSENDLGISMGYEARSGFCSYPLYMVFNQE